MLTPDEKQALEAARLDLVDQLTRVTNAIARGDKDDYIDEERQQEIPFRTAVALAARIGFHETPPYHGLTMVHLKNGACIQLVSKCAGPYSDVTLDCDIQPPVCMYYPEGS